MYYLSLGLRWSTPFGIEGNAFGAALTLPSRRAEFCSLLDACLYRFPDNQLKQLLGWCWVSKDLLPEPQACL
jgi:hypothetical protein